MFDAAALSRDAAEDEDWRLGHAAGAVPAEVSRRLLPALDLLRNTIGSQRYVDTHCWIFTPNSFLDTCAMLGTLNLFPFTVEAFHPTESGAIEFFATLRASPVAGGAEGGGEAAVEPSEPDPSGAGSEPEALRRALDDCRSRCAAHAHAVDQMRRSTSWRLTAPLRVLKRGVSGTWRTLGAIHRPVPRRSGP